MPHINTLSATVSALALEYRTGFQPCLVSLAPQSGFNAPLAKGPKYCKYSISIGAAASPIQSAYRE